MSTILADPLRNRGTAFTHEERVRLGIDGLLPPRVETLAEQGARVLAAVRAMADPLDRYRYLAALQGENETLFFRVLLDHLEELLPVVYTPTVGEACLKWSAIHERPRGLYLSARHRGRIAGVLRNWPRRDARVIVVTDGGRILGLGDLGANGMGISVGKLALYTACAGVPPGYALPVTLDVGTDNGRVRADPLYLGERVPRLAGEAWDTLLEEFVVAVQEVFPGAILQFEDFNAPCAFRLLRRYRDRLCCFNDDVQGTGAMGLAGLLAAARLTGTPLPEQRVLFAGAGEACLGIGGTVVAALQAVGLSGDDAKHRCLFLDTRGLVVASRTDLAEHKRPFAQDRAPAGGLLAAIEDFRPSALIGASGAAGLFTQPVLEAMARCNERPVVFALSNPTAKSECTAAQAYAWTQGRVVFAGGSPFEPVTLAGSVHVPGQANNSQVFPGVGLGLIVAGATRVTDGMLLAAARALAAQVSGAELAQGRLFPPAARMRETAAAVAAAVAGVAYEQAVATQPRPGDLHAAVMEAMYQPRY